MKFLGWMLLGTMALLLTGAPAIAHHSFTAEYDDQQPVKLTGVLTKVEWINPHIIYHVDVKDPSGNVVDWEFQALSPTTLHREQVTREMLVSNIGAVVTVDGYRAKNKSLNWAYGREITLPNGDKITTGFHHGDTE
jgi:hypothetical protein